MRNGSKINAWGVKSVAVCKFFSGHYPIWPLTGIFLADYLFLFINGYPDLAKIKLPKVNIGNFAAWVIGFLVSYVSIELPVVNAVVAAFAVKAVLCKMKKA